MAKSEGVETTNPFDVLYTEEDEITIQDTSKAMDVGKIVKDMDIDEEKIDNIIQNNNDKGAPVQEGNATSFGEESQSWNRSLQEEITESDMLKLAQYVKELEIEKEGT